MKKLLSGILVCTLVWGNALAESNHDQANKPSLPQKKSQKAPANGVVTPKNPTYTLKLNANPTTGYSWFVVSYPQNLVTIKNHRYVPDKASKGATGVGGTSIWQFKATQSALSAPTVIKIEMTYARPWEINDQSPTQNFYIVTNPS